MVISASHNALDDNGIKFFDAEGGKLSDELEEQIEIELARGPVTRESGLLGRATRVDKSRVRVPGILRGDACHPGLTSRA